MSFGAAEASFFADVNADNLIVSINHAKKAQRRRIQHERDIEMTVVKAAAVQISPVLYSREGTVEKVVEKIIALGHQGVQFATFPEAIVPYYPYFSSMQRPIENADQQLLVSRPPIRPTEHAGPRATLGADCWRPWPPLIKRPSWWGWPGIKPRYSKRAARLSAALDSHTQSPAEGRLWWCPSGR